MTAALAVLRRCLPEATLDVLVQLFGDDTNLIDRLALQLEEAESILANPLPVVIDTPVQQAKTVALEGRAYKVEQNVETLRKSQTDPLNKTLRAINDAFKGAIGPLLEAYGKNGRASRLGETYRRQEKQRLDRESEEATRKQVAAAEALGAALKAADQAKSDEEHYAAMDAARAAERSLSVAELEAPRAQLRGVKTVDGKVTYRQVWEFEVVDPQAIPREYLIVNEAAIKHALAAGVREIPGVNIFQTEARRRGV